MKGISLVIVIIAWLAIIYFGYIYLMRLSIDSAPRPPETSQPLQDQKQRIKDLQRDQKKLIEDRKHQMENNRFNR